jgi:hypothetical protein
MANNEVYLFMIFEHEKYRSLWYSSASIAGTVIVNPIKEPISKWARRDLDKNSFERVCKAAYVLLQD